MDQSQRQLEAQVDLKRLQKARNKAQKKGLKTVAKMDKSTKPKPILKKPALPRKRGM